MIKVVVTGSECTGKTTLARALAEQYEAPLLPEYVREHVESTGRAPRASDVGRIARAQLARQRELEDRAPDLLFLDTDLLSTYIYSWHYYGSCPAWIDEAVIATAGDLYLLAAIDVPWIADGAQRDRGHVRAEMHALFRQELIDRELRFVEVRGSHEARMRAATAAIDGLQPSRVVPVSS